MNQMPAEGEEIAKDKRKKDFKNMSSSSVFQKLKARNRNNDKKVGFDSKMLGREMDSFKAQEQQELLLK